MRHLSDIGVIELKAGASGGDPVVDFPAEGGGEEDAFRLLHDVVAELQDSSGEPPLSGLKNQLRKRRSGFSEKDFGYGGFLQFVKAARAKGFVDMEWDDEMEDYYLSVEPA